MRRGLMVALVVGVMLVACAAQATTYGSLRFAGPFNMKEFAIGMQSGTLGGEVAIGYTKASLTDLDNLSEDLDGVEPELNIMSLGGTLFMQIMGTSDYAFDVGVRYQYMSIGGKVTIPGMSTLADDELKATLSGWAAGPLLRGRWYLVDDSIAIGPEIYFKYSSYSTKLEGGGESIDGPGATMMELEYSLRMDFYF